MKKLKRAFLCAGATTFAFGLSVFAWASRDIPTAAIHELRHGYVVTDCSQGGVSYRFVQSPPSNWTTLDAVSPYARKIILLAEDARFYRHPGFDIVEIRASLFDAVLEFQRPRGASTITQQLAKNLFLTND